MQELSNILDYVPSPDKEGQQNPEHVDLEEAQNKSKKRKRRLQTFVFSATLTMPESLRKRLRKGYSPQKKVQTYNHWILIFWTAQRVQMVLQKLGDLQAQYIWYTKDYVLL